MGWLCGGGGVDAKVTRVVGWCNARMGCLVALECTAEYRSIPKLHCWCADEGALEKYMVMSYRVEELVKEDVILMKVRGWAAT